MNRINLAPKLVCAMLFAAFGAISHANAALTFTTGGGAQLQSFNWLFNGTEPDGTTPTYTMKGDGTMSLFSASTSEIIFNVTLNNTSLFTAPDTSKSIRLTAFGFGIDPNATDVELVDANDGGLLDAALSSIPSLKTIEICAYGGKNCSGGRNGGIWAGASDSFQLKIAGTWDDSVLIDPIGFKYQTDEGSYEFTASSSSGGPNTSGPVPEPGTITLLGVGILGALFYRRRVQRRA